MTPDDQRLAYLAADVGAIVWDIDADRLVLDDVGERLFGLRRGTLGGSFADLLERVREESRDTLAIAMERAVKAGALDAEVVVELPDATTRTLQLRGTALHDGDGRPTRLIAGIRDVSALEKLRADLAATRLELSMQGEELRRVSAAAEEASHANANLLARTSHEIRTRLQAILGMSRVLRDASMPPEQHELASMIEVSAQGLFGNINDLVDLSGLASELDATPVTVTTLLATATAAFTADRAPLRVEAEAADGPVVRVDVARVCRVLHHVIGSAIATSTGIVVVSGSAPPLSGTLRQLVIEVCGAGTTIAADRALFDGNDPGMIGLTISRKLVELMGGQIAAASADRDIIIRVVIPVDEVVTEEPVDEPADDRLGERNPLRILVAEDNLFSRKVADAFLQKLGYRAKFATTGREALDAIAAEPFDVVLMDVHMPVMDGLEATRRLRAAPPPIAPRIIALTANALPRDRAACLAAGCDEYLTKPVSVEKLARALRACRRAPDVEIDHGALDLSVLGNLEAVLGGEVVAELIGIYDGDARELLAGLHAAVARSDASGLARAAHNLKSTSAALGALALGATCAQLEASGRAGDLAGTAELVARADRELANVRAALGSHLARKST